jgi:uncharacterized protein (DUF885 family)
MHHFVPRAALAALLTLLAGAARAATYTPEQIAAESAKANAFFERTFNEAVDRSPEFQTQLGIKKDYDKWDDGSDARDTEDLALTVAHLAELKQSLNFEALDHQTQLSYRLWQRQAERRIEGYKWRLYNYPVNQMFGEHSGTPALLINLHQISDVKDAQAYIARLKGIKPKFDELIVGLEARRAKNIVPPKFVFPLVLESSRGIITGEPFDTSGKPSALLEDFQQKLGKLTDADPATKDRLLADAKLALTDSVRPAYQALIAELEALEKVATDDDGVWKFANGGDYYNYALRNTTTTDLSADQIHEIGLKEVARIHAEMTAIKDEVGFKGDLLAFFKFMRTDPRFYFPNTPEGKAAYLAGATQIIDTMRGRLDELFLTKPKAAIVVKAVEPFRERESGGAFYGRPAPDGSRPGTYYVNLYDMGGVAKYEMEALAYHEGIPGHHMQIAIAQELTGVPKFRKFGFYTAYIEGWGLYCERIPKEMGFYADPYSNFGRLAMENWRAARLVVDTGLHAKHWTRQQTMDWLRANTPNSERDILTETNRYIVMAGQATAYKIGMLKILELRELATKELGGTKAQGGQFDIREFHDVVLKDGAVPLDILEENVRAWIAAKKKT